MQMLKYCQHGSIYSAAKQAACAVHCSVTTMFIHAPATARSIASDCPSQRRQQRSIAGALNGAQWRPTASARRQFHSSIVVRAVPDVAVSEANLLVSSGDWQYLDVRTEQEFADGHAPQSVNIPIASIGLQGMQPNPNFLADVEAEFPDKEGSSLIVGCKAGPRSSKAVQILDEAGYKNLMNVTGGFMAWEASGLPVEK